MSKFNANKKNSFNYADTFSLKDKYEASKESIVSSKSIISDDESKPSDKQESSLKKEVVEKEEDINVLGAKLIKAELFGDQEQIKSLKARLEAARQRAESRKPIESTTKNESANRNSNSSHNDRRSDNKKSNEREPQKSAHKRNHHQNNKNNNTEKNDYETQDKKLKRPESEASTASSAVEIVESCLNCFENAKKHLIVSIGKYCYLCLPARESLVEGHCMILPIGHQSSAVTCDEEVWSEVQDYKKALVKMFQSRRTDCVFIEQYNSHRRLAHMIIECIPLEQDISNLAPIYFKKALVESEGEWTQNKSLIDLKKQGLRKTIPRNMAYFAVDFGMDEGYAHIIENNESFPDHFAKEVIGGILDLDPMQWMRPQKEDLNQQSQKVIEFSKLWKSYEFNSKAK